MGERRRKGRAIPHPPSSSCWAVSAKRQSYLRASRTLRKWGLAAGKGALRLGHWFLVVPCLWFLLVLVSAFCLGTHLPHGFYLSTGSQMTMDWTLWNHEPKWIASLPLVISVYGPHIKRANSYRPQRCQSGVNKDVFVFYESEYIWNCLQKITR